MVGVADLTGGVGEASLDGDVARKFLCDMKVQLALSQLRQLWGPSRGHVLVALSHQELPLHSGFLCFKCVLSPSCIGCDFWLRNGEKWIGEEH